MKQKKHFNQTTIDRGLKSGKIQKFSESEVNSSLSLREFDHAFTFKIFNDINPDTYYNILSCDKHIEKVMIPMLCINSQNDPISKYLL
jgi:predicted alpha/beta-fold hydrolase